MISMDDTDKKESVHCFLLVDKDTPERFIKFKRRVSRNTITCEFTTKMNSDCLLYLEDIKRYDIPSALEKKNMTKVCMFDFSLDERPKGIKPVKELMKKSGYLISDYPTLKAYLIQLKTDQTPSIVEGLHPVTIEKTDRRKGKLFSKDTVSLRDIAEYLDLKPSIAKKMYFFEENSDFAKYLEPAKTQKLSVTPSCGFKFTTESFEKLLDEVYENQQQSKYDDETFNDGIKIVESDAAEQPTSSESDKTKRINENKNIGYNDTCAANNEVPAFSNEINLSAKKIQPQNEETIQILKSLDSVSDSNEITTKRNMINTTELLKMIDDFNANAGTQENVLTMSRIMTNRAITDVFHYYSLNEQEIDKKNLLKSILVLQALLKNRYKTKEELKRLKLIKKRMMNPSYQLDEENTEISYFPSVFRGLFKNGKPVKDAGEKIEIGDEWKHVLPL